MDKLKVDKPNVDRPKAVHQFHIQNHICAQNLRLVDAQIQHAIVKAEQAGDFEDVDSLSGYEAQLALRQTNIDDKSEPSDDETLKAATNALMQLNKRMRDVVAGNKAAAVLIKDLADLFDAGSNLWDTATKKKGAGT